MIEFDSKKDYNLVSRLSDMPMAKIVDTKPVLFFKGKSWAIDTILKEFYSLDTDVYGFLNFNDEILDQLFDILSETKKLSLVRASSAGPEAKATLWRVSSNDVSVQEEFLDWLVKDLKCDFYN